MKVKAVENSTIYFLETQVNKAIQVIEDDGGTIIDIKYVVSGKTSSSSHEIAAFIHYR